MNAPRDEDEERDCFVDSAAGDRTCERGTHRCIVKHRSPEPDTEDSAQFWLRRAQEEAQRYFDAERDVSSLVALLSECQGALTGPAELRQRIEDTLFATVHRRADRRIAVDIIHSPNAPGPGPAQRP